MGTPGFAVPTLETLYQMGHQIAAVLCQPDRPAGRGRNVGFSPVKQKALALGLSIYQPETLKTTEIIQGISKLEPDALVVVAYGLKLPSDILNIPRYGAVNLHPSLLPKYRGAAPINHALINGDKVTGISAILMNDRMDAGDIVLQEEVPIRDDENAGELENRLAALGADLISRSLEDLMMGTSKLKKQDELMATSAPKLSPEDGHINWERTSREICNQIRGMTPRPGAFVMFKSKRLEIIKAGMETGNWKLETGMLPGQVAGINKNMGPAIMTGDGTLILTMVKPQGKKAMSGGEFIRGYKPEAGEMLS